MTDTHSHIYGPEFAEDISEVILRAKTAGVERIFLPNINKDTVTPMLALCNTYPDYLYPMMGLHPTDLTPDFMQVLDVMEKTLQEDAHPYIAIGEVGLDYYWDRTFYAEQQQAFRRQIEWAIAFHLPLMIHSRAAFPELFSIMSDYKDSGLTGVFHCFGGTADEARALLSFEGFVLGIGGVVTYRKSTLPEVLREVPLDRIVLETDAPYLAPVPYRGKRNESSYLPEIVKTLSNIYKVDESEVERQTEANASRIFQGVKWK